MLHVSSVTGTAVTVKEHGSAPIDSPDFKYLLLVTSFYSVCLVNCLHAVSPIMYVHINSKSICVHAGNITVHALITDLMDVLAIACM